ncbi:MAG: type II secretion system F family protein [Clostridia bacterium]
MKSIDMAILLLSCCFAVILLVSLYIVFGKRLSFNIRKTASAIQAKGRKGLEMNTGMQVDYDSYHMPVREKFISALAAGAVIFTTGYIFYRSIALSLLLIPLALFYPRFRAKDIIKKRKNELNLQFREALYSIASSLSAGKSIETSFKDAQKELSIQYPDAGTYIIMELEQINKMVEMNETIEEALADFAVRSNLEDILNFADVFTICKRTGGNLVQVVKNTAEIISEKIDVKQEISVLLTEKKLEHKILNLMPVFIVLMLSTSAAEFMAPVFNEPLGRAAMTFSLVLFTAAYFISRKIMDIEV